MNILILGANGHVGSQVAGELLTRGHTVLAAVHKNSDKVPADAQIVHVDVQDEAALVDVLQGADAVVCALSSWHEPQHDVLSTAMRSVIPAMERAGVARIVTISGDVARVPDETPSLMTKMFHAVAFGAVRAVVEDSEDHVCQLHESTLNWTAIRPTPMTSSRRTSYHLQPTHPWSLSVPRAAVVQAIADLVESGKYARQAPFVV